MDKLISTNVSGAPLPISTTISANNTSVSSQVAQIPQIQTTVQDNRANAVSIVNAPFVQVTSVNGMTGDVQVDSIISTFVPRKYYAKGQAMIHEGVIYVAKANMTTGDTIDEEQWLKTEAKQPSPQTLSINNRDLSISLGNTVSIPETPPQQLRIQGHNLSISSGNSVELPIPPPQVIPKATHSADGLMPKEDKTKLDGLAQLLNTLRSDIETSLLNRLHPVGSLYLTTTSENPSSTLGGTWQSYAQGRALVGVGSNGSNNYTVGQEFGRDKVTLTDQTVPNTYIGFLPAAVPAGHGAWSNAGIAAASRPTKDGKYYGPLITSGPHHWGWELRTGGGGQPHENRQSSVAVFIWRRVA